ncbi:hypothetical protein [Paenibacillus sp. MSJ-34]|uniref:hypothetical protein n=1 Tax=Paenibacillus sp. MSJ-34 TaxID=2841529 RepID=UPI001C11D548|nr:hypothetical protein [Paenibacillus sp. MSJ-34]MBU5443105.1 hypothetical protein [Paenibacillus sp. MSJ-34]
MRFNVASPLGAGTTFPVYPPLANETETTPVQMTEVVCSHCGQRYGLIALVAMKLLQ